MSVELEFMYNRTGKRRLGRIYSTVGEGKVLYSTIPKPGIFGLGIRHFDDKSCTWKRGHGRYWYVQKEFCHGGVDIWNCLKTCITLLCSLFISLFVCLFNDIPVGGSFPVKLQAVCLLILAEFGSFVGVSQVFCLFYYLLCEQLFWGNYC